ncbi:MAG: TonB family protein, partial [Proteobacteria bacterium]|nr:TonB family protein [Pseudomonadota bacterium]
VDVEYPRLALMTRAAGDVLVLFVTDDDGWVIRAEVAEPIGSGLDIVAEQIVRTMHFKLQSVEDLPAALRSQVTVAFNR